jgi:hypothetical protein
MWRLLSYKASSAVTNLHGFLGILAGRGIRARGTYSTRRSQSGLHPRRFLAKLESMTRFMTTAELAADARKALREPRESSHEHFEQLVQLGWINRQGEVTRLLGGDAQPEPDSEPGRAARAKRRKRQSRP